MPSLLETITLDDHEDFVELFRTGNNHTIKVIVVQVLITLLLFFFMTPLFRQGIWGVGLFLTGLGLCAVIVWRTILKWVGSVCITTTNRIVLVDRAGFWKKHVSEIAYKEIVRAQYSKQGIINTLRDIGSVQCVLKSSSSAFEIHNIVHPQRLLEIISTHTTFSSSDHL